MLIYQEALNFLLLSFTFLAVIFPTLWEYLRSFGVAENNVYWLGLVISAATVSDMFVGLIIGRFLDKISRVLPLALVLNIFQIIGSFVYFLGNSPTVLLISRFIGGIGNGAALAFTTGKMSFPFIHLLKLTIHLHTCILFQIDVCRATTLEERTPVLLTFNIAQQLGLLLGPACNLFLRELEFSIGPLHVNKLNAPGLFLTILYILFEILSCFMYYDLKVAKDQEHEDMMDDTTPIINNDTIAINNDDDAVDVLEDDPSSVDAATFVPWSRYATELLRGEIIALMFLRFIGLFGQTW